MFEGHIKFREIVWGDFKTATGKLYIFSKYTLFVDKFCNIIENSF